MNYGDLPKKILNKLMAAVALINNIEVDPIIRQRNMEILFYEVGLSVYNKVYDMNAFDMEIEHTVGTGIDNRYYGLAKIAAGAPVTAVADLQAMTLNYLQEMSGKAQNDAFSLARQSGQYPTVERSIVSETCKWCQTLAGVHRDPTPEVFMRHSHCDCRIVTYGYKSRNGLLKNYKK